MQGAVEIAAPTEAELLLRFGVALGLGMLLGLERERRKEDEAGFAGVRTFALIALSGALSAWIGERLGIAWITPITFAAVALLVLASYVLSSLRGDLGITTEVTALVAFLMGVMCERGEVQLAAAVGVAVTLVLVLKEWLHALAGRIEAEDVAATLKFAIVSLIVLPLVPDRSFGPPPFDVLNPYRIWLMVVLISAVDFVSWLLVKLIGREHGIGLTGLLGGLVSSTALTLGFTKRSRQQPELGRPLALGILLAWTVMIARVAVLVGVTRLELLRGLAAPLGAMAAVSALAILWLWRRARAEARAEVASGSNPFELGKAVRFGLLFGAVVFLARAADVWMGARGVYLASLLAGLTDVDAITLSMAQMSSRDPQATETAARAVALAVVANTLVKGGIAASAGAPVLRRILLPLALALAAACIASAFLV
jgi:uncharacterized membrane protein (DUF4010 family)